MDDLGDTQIRKNSNSSFKDIDTALSNADKIETKKITLTPRVAQDDSSLGATPISPLGKDVITLFIFILLPFNHSDFLYRDGLEVSEKGSKEYVKNSYHHHQKALREGRAVVSLGCLKSIALRKGREMMRWRSQQLLQRRTHRMEGIPRIRQSSRTFLIHGGRNLRGSHPRQLFGKKPDRNRSQSQFGKYQLNYNMVAQPSAKWNQIHPS